MSELYFQKVRTIFEEFLLVFQDNNLPILKLDKWEIERLNNEWKKEMEK